MSPSHGVFHSSLRRRRFASPQTSSRSLSLSSPFTSACTTSISSAVNRAIILIAAIVTSLLIIAPYPGRCDANVTITTDTAGRCIDFELNRIDAITTLTNGSTLLFGDGHYWILAADEIPSIEAARAIDRLVTISAEPAGRSPASNVISAANVGVTVRNGKCEPTTKQLLLYSWWSNATTGINQSTISVYQNDTLYTTSKVQDVDAFKAASSVDWSRPINAMAYWENMLIIFQDEFFHSVRCENGQWKAVTTRQIDGVFPGVPAKPVDTVMIRHTEGELDAATIFMFYGKKFYKCSATGNDRCEGPYSLMSEFFRVDHYCSHSPLGRAASGRRLAIALILLTVILFSVIAVALALYFLIKPEHFTYFVNGKMRNNYNRDTFSYESLKRQNDTPTSGVECKSVTNGK